MEHDTNTIKEKVHQYVLQQTFADKEKIQYDTLLFREGYFDSMGFIMLITFIEDEFSIKTNDSDLIEENFESINAIASFITSKS